MSQNEGNNNINANASTVQEWLRDGEELYTRLLLSYADTERQIEELEARLGARAAEINQLARFLGKPPMTPARRAAAELVVAEESADAAAGNVGEAELMINATRVRTSRAVTAKFATERVVATPAATRILDAIPGRNVE